MYSSTAWSFLIIFSSWLAMVFIVFLGQIFKLLQTRDFISPIQTLTNQWRAHQYKNPTLVARFGYAWSITVDKSYQKPRLKNEDPNLNCQSIVTYEWLLAVELFLLSLALDELLDGELFM